MRNGLAFLGGTFDPIHLGHLRLLWSVYERVPVTRVCLVPLFAPVHDKIPVASPEQRRRMVELSIASTPELALESFELDQQRAVYTVETVHYLRSQHPALPLIWVMGADQWNTVPRTWHQPALLARYVHVLVIPRSDKADRAVAHELGFECVNEPRELTDTNLGKWCELPLPHLDISSSAIRQWYAEGRRAKYVLPDAVDDYILAQHLYR